MRAAADQNEAVYSVLVGVGAGVCDVEKRLATYKWRPKDGCGSPHVKLQQAPAPPLSRANPFLASDPQQDASRFDFVGGRKLGCCCCCCNKFTNSTASALGPRIAPSPSINSFGPAYKFLFLPPCWSRHKQSPIPLAGRVAASTLSHCRSNPEATDPQSEPQPLYPHLASAHTAYRDWPT